MIKQEDRVGLCMGCFHAGITRTLKGGGFYLCRRSQNDPNYSKYPNLPIRSCPGFEPIPLSSPAS